MVPAGPGCENEVRKKKVKRHMVFLLFYCISFRCRLLEGFGFGFVFCFSFSCRLLEGFGCGGEFTQKNLEWMFWKVLAVKTNSQKTVKTPHGFPHFLWYLMHSGVMFSGFSGLLEVYGSGTAGPGCENAVRKKGKTPHGFLLFYCISFGCRLLEDFGFGFVFCFSFSCRLLEGSGCGDECAKTT